MEKTTPSDLIPSKIKDEMPAMVKQVASKWDEVQQESFIEEFERKRKSSAVAYILWFLLGWHYLYLQGWARQLMFWLSWFIGIGVIWWIVDIFRVPSLVKEYNQDVAKEVARDMQLLAGG